MLSKLLEKHVYQQLLNLLFIYADLKQNLLIRICTVNQLQLATTLFHNIPDINWFEANNFRDQGEDYLKNHITSHLRTGLRRTISATTNSKLSQKMRKIIAREIKLVNSKSYYKTG